LKPRKLKFQTLDLVLLALAAAGGGYLYWRVGAKLDYQWEWSAIPQYLLRYDPEKGRLVTNVLIQGLLTTIRLSFWSMILATILGTIMGLFRTSHSRFKRMLGATYVELIRNLPPLVLVFIFFYFVSDQIMPSLGVNDFIRNLPPAVQNTLAFFFAEPGRFAAFMAAVLTLALYEGAYITEIVRSGIQSVERGQWEAAYALGLSWTDQMRFVVLPQAAQRTIPPLAGQFISTVKDSAIVSVISIQELTYQGLQLMAATYLTFEIWITVTALYLALTLLLSFAAKRLETHMGRGVY
jgi:polar amino acid transport system permease protein